MDLHKLSNEELLELSQKLEDKDDLRKVATFVDVTFSGNTGFQTLKDKVIERIRFVIQEEIAAEAAEAEEARLAETKEDPNDPIAQILAKQIAEEGESEDVHVEQTKTRFTHAQMMEMDAAQVRDPRLRRQVIRAQALRLRRVRITNLDPSDSAVPATFVSVYNKYTGKVGKLIPHDSDFYENGYHIPQIIYDELKTRQFNMRKEVKGRGSSFGVKSYKHIPTRKFLIEDLPPLTAQERKALGESQQARGAIDRAA